MKDPAVLFYTQDFITGTLLMNYEQKGKYITLLCIQQQNGKLTEKDLLKICGGKDDDIWAKFDQDDDGKFYNKRMLIESERRKKYVESRKINAKHMDKHMESHMEIRNKKYEISNKKEENEILLKKREEKFRNDVYIFTNDPYPLTMLQKFCDYWTEKNKSHTKMLWELKPTFEISKRLVTWASRDNNIVKIKKQFTHAEMLDMLNKNPDFKWDDYNTIKIDGGKCVYELNNGR